MRIVPVPCLSDNYAYLVIDEATKEAAVVDPSEAAPVLAAAEREGVKLVAIWNTHHHWDHVGGNEELVKQVKPREVSGHASDKGRIAEQTRFLETGDVVKLGPIEARATHVPGHTLGAVAYFIDGGEGKRAVFTGDTLFLAGCGRLFEGTPSQMFESMRKLSSLPPDTQVFCGHEYTASNLRFALHVEPDNADVKRAIEETSITREAGRPTVPGTIARELATNPFVRAKSVDELAQRRTAKDSFK